MSAQGIIERCPDCGCFLAHIGAGDTTCANARCASSWQAAQRDFEGSMLGAAIRQLIAERDVPEGETLPLGDEAAA